MTTPRSTYYNYTYRSDGVKMREQSNHQYTKLVMKISASGDTTYVQRNASDTHFRAHYGNYVKETGQPDKIYNEEGYIALHGDSVSYHFFERDYLGSVRAVFVLYGNLEQTNDYNVTGIPSSRHLGNADAHKHTGKEFQRFNGLAWYDNRARYYDCILARFTTQDPLAEKYPWLSPYNHCANNPLRYIDQNGDSIAVLNLGGIIGHSALLIQNENHKWKYYSMNGNNLYKLTDGKIGGKPYHDIGSKIFNSPQELFNTYMHIVLFIDFSRIT